MKLYKAILSVILSLLLIFAVGCSPSTAVPDGQNTDAENLKVHFIDVGQGDAVFLEFPNGDTMLIDAGEKEYGTTVSEYIKNLGYNTVSYIIGTHPHSDHIGGLAEIIRGFNIGSVYLPKASSTTKTFEDLLDAIKDKGLLINTAKAGAVIIEKDNLKAEVLSPVKDEYTDLNDYSVVLKITYINNSFLFTGDAEAGVEADIERNLSADVLKVGHHGSSTSSSKAFLEKVSPKYAVISCGSDNKYGHPHIEVINRLKKLNVTILRTDIHGNIVLSSDGNNIKATTEAGEPVTQTESSQPQTQNYYVLNISSKKIHYPYCDAVAKIKPENSQNSYEKIEELIVQGYSPCGSCKPE